MVVGTVERIVQSNARHFGPKVPKVITLMSQLLKRQTAIMLLQLFGRLALPLARNRSTAPVQSRLMRQ